MIEIGNLVSFCSDGRLVQGIVTSIRKKKNIFARKMGILDLDFYALTVVDFDNQRIWKIPSHEVLEDNGKVDENTYQCAVDLSHEIKNHESYPPKKFHFSVRQ